MAYDDGVNGKKFRQLTQPLVKPFPACLTGLLLTVTVYHRHPEKWIMPLFEYLL